MIMHSAHDAACIIGLDFAGRVLIPIKNTSIIKVKT